MYLDHTNYVRSGLLTWLERIAAGAPGLHSQHARNEGMKTDGSLELEFLRKYKDAILYFNLLEWNMAYCLFWAAEFAGTKLSMSKALAYSYDAKLRKIRSLIVAREREAAYAGFLIQAEQCRLYRNKLVHGQWDLRENLEKPVRFSVRAPLEESGGMTFAEFTAQTTLFKKTLSLFLKLRKSHPIEQPD